ncbi:MAG: hypothetical protein JNL92_08355 [Opitutaceae bacterium]|nr:hypothetical protein [Opitutaceae bacterium]
MRTAFLSLLLALALCPSTAHAALAHPQLTTLTRESPATIAPGGKVEFRYAITPGTAATRSLTIVLNAPGGIRGVQLLTVENPGSGIASATVDSTWLDGRYQIESVRVVDQWSRTVTYRADDTVRALPSDGAFYAEGRSHDLGFSGLTFVVTGATAQQRRPELTTLTLRSAGTVTPGDTVRVGYTITAGQSPLTRVAMSFRHATAATTVTLSRAQDTTALNGEITLPVAAAVMNGRYRLNLVTLTDAAGRQTTYAGFGAVSEFFDQSSFPADLEPSNVSVNAVEFFVEGASAAATLPRVASLARDGGGTASVGDILRFSYVTTEAGYPVERVVATVYGPYGGTQTFTSNASSGVFTIPVAPHWISGVHTVRITSIVDSAGRSAAASGLTLSASFDVRALLIPVYFTEQPEAETRVVAGRFVTLISRGVGLEPVSFQWFRGESGDTRTPLASDQGLPNQITFPAQESATYWVRLASGAATIDSRAARVVVFPPSAAGRLINLSVLTSLDSPTDEFTLGYVVGGNGTSGAKPLVLRAAGPSLGALGVPGTISDPTMGLFAGANLAGGNDNWGGGADLVAAFAAVGAFPFSGPAARDAAIATNIATRNNSVLVTGVGGATGAVIAEVYDATPAGSFGPATPRLLNVSVRKHLRAGLTAGFVIGGSTNLRVLIRVVGPGIAPFGVLGTVVDPQLVLFRGAEQIGANNDWALDIATAGNSVGAFALTSGSRDAALVATLQPGNYSVLATGVGGTTGVALVEVYELP